MYTEPNAANTTAPGHTATGAKREDTSVKGLLKLLIVIALAAVAIGLINDRENDSYRDLYRHYVKLDLDGEDEPETV